MHNIHIIGNGFDLAHGMKTSYNDLIKKYLINVLTNNHPADAQEAKVINHARQTINSEFC